ncbi:GNAT family N-acetyltransferase [Agrococcus sp. ProA11]|uniref:GNAT family N-acetyltransferase n=1 Tax=Agrococcus chionoecetis TaxID=3153752 RepID=UPI00325FF41C
MPTPSRVRIAVHDDRAALMEFVCTQPAKQSFGVPHPRPWELVTQSAFRELRPPMRDGSQLYVLEEDGVIAGLCRTRPTDDGAVLIASIAVSHFARCEGRGAALLGEVLDEIQATRPGVDVIARIHSRNEPSRKLFRAFGFEYVEPFEGGGSLDVFGLVGPDVEEQDSTNGPSTRGW